MEVYLKDGSVRRRSQEPYATTTHELGHSAHYAQQDVNMSFNLDELRDRLKADYPPNGTRIYTNADSDNLFAYWKAL